MTVGTRIFPSRARTPNYARTEYISVYGIGYHGVYRKYVEHVYHQFLGSLV